MALYAHLKDRNIITAPRGDRLRIAPHLYNTFEDIDALVEHFPVKHGPMRNFVSE